jgi:protein-S-isoprenylcysteine O-methyltransferase Ste14
MGLDIRMPIGLMFTAFGLILIVFGLAGNHAIYERSLWINVNGLWGAVLLVFGLIMLVFGMRGNAKNRALADQNSNSPRGSH